MSKKIYVHDWIIHHGGAEQVLKDLIDKEKNTKKQDKSPIFCLFAKEKEFHGHPIITALPAWLNNIFVNASKHRFFLIRWLFDYRNAMLFYPQLTWLLRRKIKKLQPKQIIISSFAVAKNIIPPEKKSSKKNAPLPSQPTDNEQTNKSISKNNIPYQLNHTQVDITLYLHSPMQYIWENYQEYRKKLTGIRKWLFIFITGKLQARDKKKRTYSTVYCNSKYTLESAHKHYNWEAYLPEKPTVQYPKLPEIFKKTRALKQPFTYYLFVGRIVKYVRGLDQVIKAFNEVSLPLLIMGSGPDERELKQLAGPTVTFLGYVDDLEEKATIIKQAKGLINIAKESCGIGTMEALSLGVPVLGYNAGGTVELLTPEAGMLIEDRSVEDIADALEKFDGQQFDRRAIKKNFLKYYDSVGSIK